MGYFISIYDDEPLFCQKICDYPDTYQDETEIEFKLLILTPDWTYLESIPNRNFYHIIVLNVELGSINEKPILGTDTAKGEINLTPYIRLLMTSSMQFSLKTTEGMLQKLSIYYHYYQKSNDFAFLPSHCFFLFHFCNILNQMFHFCF